MAATKKKKKTPKSRTQARQAAGKCCRPTIRSQGKRLFGANAHLLCTEERTTRRAARLRKERTERSGAGKKGNIAGQAREDRARTEEPKRPSMAISKLG